MATQPYFTVGCTKRFRENPLKKDGSIWDLSSATVTAVFIPPTTSGLSEFERSATVDDGTGGVCSYTTLTTDLSAAGDWEMYFKIEDGSIVERTLPYSFRVHSV